MIRKKSLLLLALVQTGFAMAGGLLTNTNQSVHFLRNPARDASTQIDAVYTNPAGLVKLTDGFHFSFNNQSAFQTREITSTSPIFKYNGGSEVRQFNAKASAPIIPSLQGAYKKGNWVLSGSLAITGGGGKATFDRGLPSFESTIGSTTSILTRSATTFLPYTDDSFMKGSSFIIGGQLGGTYKINESFSAYAGFRLNVVSNKYEGYLRDFQVSSLAGNTYSTFAAAYGTVSAQIAALQAAGQSIPEALVKANSGAAFAAQAASQNGVRLESSQSGWGVAPIIGFNYNWNDKLNIGAKYEFRTSLEVENDTKVDDTGLFKNGVNTPHDIPAYFSIGASYKILPALTASAGYHHFFDSDAKMTDDKQKYAGSTNEYLAGVEYQINRMFLISAGAQITDYGVQDAYQRDLSFAVSSYSVGIGGAVNVSEKVRINVGYFWTNYDTYTKTPGGNTAQDIFTRTNKVFGAGIDFSF